MASRKRVSKPSPVVVTTICSICGEDWAQHAEVDGEVSTLECVRLLKAKIAMTPHITIQRPYVYPWWQQQWTYTGITCGTTTQNVATSQYVQNTAGTPTVALASAAA